MVQNISAHPDNARCTIDRYKGLWLKRSTMNKLMVEYFNKDAKNKKNCVHPRYHSDHDTVEHDQDMYKQAKYCYLIEKGPSYLNSPWVAAIYSLLLPRIKVIGLIRNPVNHVWSNYWAFGQIRDENDAHFESDISKIEKYILDKFMHSFSFNALRDFCIEMNVGYKQLNLSSKSVTDNDWNMERYNRMRDEYYLNFMGLYLKLRFIEPMDILIGLRDDGFIWFPLQIIHLLFWLNSYDEHGIYNNLKIIQSEYFFGNINLARNEVRCWLSNGYECGYQEILESLNIDNQSVPKNHANYNQRPSDNFVHSFLELFHPFNEALYNLLHDRPEILIGKWIQWHY